MEARPATGAMAGPDFTAWIGARAMSPASITPPCDVTTIMAPANPAARNRALMPSRYSPISGLSEASMQVAEARRYSRTDGFTACDRLTATPGKCRASSSPIRRSWRGLTIDHSRHTPTASTPSAARAGTRASTAPSSSGRSTRPSAPIRSGTSNVSARGTYGSG